VLWHGGGRAWWLLVAALGLLAIVFAWLAPRGTASPSRTGPRDEATLADDDAVGTDIASVQAVLAQRCGACHSANPTLLPSPPLGVSYDTPAQIEGHAARIHQQTVVLRIMPPGNLTRMTEAERAAIDAWFRARAHMRPQDGGRPSID